MAAVLIAIVAFTAIGLPIAYAIDRRISLGLAFLYGSGWIFFALLALPRWSPGLVAIAALVPFALLFRTGHWARGTGHSKPHWLDLITAALLLGYGFFATIAPPWEWDFWVIWGMKARVFFERGGIDWRFLESRWNAYAHPDYPLLLPLDFDFVALLHRGWDDRWLGFLFVVWAVALLLIVRDLASRETTTAGAALITLAAATIAVNRYIGMAEGPMIALGSGGVLFARRALQSDDGADWLHASLLLGLAANAKNEGLALLIAAIIALLVVRPREVWRLWPAAAVAAPWLLIRATHHFATDILASDVEAGSTLHRVMVHVPQTREIAVLLARMLYERWFWIAMLAGILIVPAVARRELFVIVVTAIQTAFYVGAYFATPSGVQWHIFTSWPRLTEQIAVPITYVVVLALWQCFRRVPASLC